jgi:hypothetical protein
MSDLLAKLCSRSEGTALDFKQCWWSTTNQEFAKDIIALCNSPIDEAEDAFPGKAHVVVGVNDAKKIVGGLKSMPTDDNHWVQMLQTCSQPPPDFKFIRCEEEQVMIVEIDKTKTCRPVVLQKELLNAKNKPVYGKGE